MLYAATDFATAFIEVVVRDRLVQSDRRIVPFGDMKPVKTGQLENHPELPDVFRDHAVRLEP